MPTKNERPSDTEMLDWLEKNIFHREITDDWDKRLYGAKHSMWVMFAPKGHQGSARNIVAAAMAEQAAATVKADGKPPLLVEDSSGHYSAPEAAAGGKVDAPAEPDRYVQCNDCGSWKKMIPGNHHPWCSCGSDRFRWEDERDHDPEASVRSSAS